MWEAQVILAPEDDHPRIHEADRGTKFDAEFPQLPVVGDTIWMFRKPLERTEKFEVRRVLMEFGEDSTILSAVVYLQFSG